MQDTPDYHLVLIDDGSIDGTAEMVTARIRDATVIRGTGRWWWAGSLQQGFKWVRSRDPGPDDIVLITNDDTEFEPDFLSKGRLTLAGTGRSLLLAQLYGLSTGELIEVGAHADWSTLDFRGVQTIEQVNCFSTRGLFVRARDFVEIGGFHPTILPHYGSDYEFTIRAHRKGFKFLSSPDVRLSVREDATGTLYVRETSVRRFLRTSFRRKTVANPFLQTTFVILACPKRLVPLNVFRVWKRFCGDLVRCAF